MFTIIASVIGIGVAIVLLLVGWNMLGAAYSDSGEKSKYAAYQNTGNQIKGAVQFYTTTHGAPPTGTGEEIIQILEGATINGQNPDGIQYVKHIPRDLVSPPAPGTRENWTIVGKYAFTPLADIAQCKKMNGYANLLVDGAGAPADGCPVCSDAAFDAYPACRNN